MSTDFWSATVSLDSQPVTRKSCADALLSDGWTLDALIAQFQEGKSEFAKGSPDDWQPYVITKGKRKGQAVWKNAKTGSLRDEPPGGKGKGKDTEDGTGDADKASKTDKGDKGDKGEKTKPEETSTQKQTAPEPTAKQMQSSIASAYEAIKEKGGKSVTIPEMVDRLCAAHPGLSEAKAQHALVDANKNDMLTLKVHDATVGSGQATRLGEGIKTSQGVLYSVVATKDQLQKLRSDEPAKPDAAKPDAAKPETKPTPEPEKPAPADPQKVLAPENVEKAQSTAATVLEHAARVINYGSVGLYALSRPISFAIGGIMNGVTDQAEKDAERLTKRYGAPAAHLICATGTAIAALNPLGIGAGHTLQYTEAGRWVAQLPAVAVAEAAMATAKGAQALAGMAKSGFNSVLGKIKASLFPGKKTAAFGLNGPRFAMLNLADFADDADDGGDVTLTKKMIKKEAKAFAMRMIKAFHDALSKQTDVVDSLRMMGMVH